MQKATIWKTKCSAHWKLASSQKAVSACACSQLEARRTTDKNLKNTYLAFIKVWCPTITYVLSEFRKIAKREPEGTQSEELYFFPRIGNKCFIFWRDPKETFWLSSEYSAVEQYLSPLSHLRLLRISNAGLLMGHDFVRLSIYSMWGSEGNQKETTWLQYKAIQRQVEGPGGETSFLFLVKQQFQVH